MDSLIAGCEANFQKEILKLSFGAFPPRRNKAFLHFNENVRVQSRLSQTTLHKQTFVLSILLVTPPWTSPIKYGCSVNCWSWEGWVSCKERKGKHYIQPKYGSRILQENMNKERSANKLDKCCWVVSRL